MSCSLSSGFGGLGGAFWLGRAVVREADARSARKVVVICIFGSTVL
jgi:hypothetical protein